MEYIYKKSRITVLMTFLLFIGASSVYAQCDTITGVSITVPTAKTVAKKLDAAGGFAAGDATINFTAAVAAGSNPVYEWYVDGMLQLGQTSASFVLSTPTAEGIYSVYAAAANACTKSNTVRSKPVTVIVTQAKAKLILDPDELFFAFDESGSGDEQTVIITTNCPDPWTASVVYHQGSGWLTVVPAPGTPSLGTTFTVVPNGDNDSGAPRSATITLSACGMQDSIVVTQTPDPDDVPGGGDPLPNTYVGAFWRAGEMGERIIRIRDLTDAGDLGYWTASVFWTDDRWSAGDIVLSTAASADAGITWDALTENPASNAGVESYTVGGTAQWVSGNVATGDSIYFRIGLKTQYNSAHPKYNANFPVRYAVVLLTYNGSDKMQKIFLRQGEEADVVSQTFVTGGGTGFKPKWSPYNLGNVNDATNYPDKFVGYPSQAGFLYQWTNSVTSYSPTGPVTLSGSTSGNLPNLCPYGFKVPTGDESGNGYNPAIDTSAQASLKSNVGTGINHVWGYYADGFFDRRAIVSSEDQPSGGTANSAVSIGDNVAYIGLLCYNSGTEASLFLPATGRRYPGDLNNTGALGYLWSSSLSTNGLNGFDLAFYDGGMNTNMLSSFYAFPVRCVVDPPYLEVDPGSYLFLYNQSGSGVAKSFTVSTNQLNWSWSATYSGCTVSDFTIIPNNVTNTLEIYPNSSNPPPSTTIRAVTITITAGSESETVYVYHDIDGGGTLPIADRSYVGAFWRAGQTGERIIRLSNIPAGAAGAWTASVAWTDGNWSSSDIILDAGPIDLAARNISFTNTATPYDNPDPAEAFPVGGNATIVTGTTATGGNIVFRIGLKTQYNPTTDPARYAIIMLSYNNNTQYYKIFLRQGEAADIVSSTYITGGGTGEKPKWTPYNLEDVNSNKHNNGGFTDYPSQAGFFYKWDTPLTAFPPTGIVDIEMGYTTGDCPLVCPPGFKVPTGGSEINTTEFTVLDTSALSTFRTPDINNVWGYYADGFFDRRAIVSNTTVATGNLATGINVAYIGQLFYNPETAASLFLPAAGMRNGDLLIVTGTAGDYWSNSSASSGNAYVLRFHSGLVYPDSHGKPYGMSVRCIAGDPYLGVSPPNNNFLSAQSGMGATKTFTVSTNQLSWNYGVSGADASDFEAARVGNTITVYPKTPNVDIAGRSMTVTVSAGSATPVPVAVTQDPEPFLGAYWYQANYGTGNSAAAFTRYSDEHDGYIFPWNTVSTDIEVMSNVGCLFDAGTSTLGSSGAVTPGATYTSNGVTVYPHTFTLNNSNYGTVANYALAFTSDPVGVDDTTRSFRRGIQEWSRSGVTSVSAGYNGLSAPANITVTDNVVWSYWFSNWTDKGVASGASTWTTARAGTQGFSTPGTAGATQWDDRLYAPVAHSGTYPGAGVLTKSTAFQVNVGAVGGAIINSSAAVTRTAQLNIRNESAGGTALATIPVTQYYPRAYAVSYTGLTPAPQPCAGSVTGVGYIASAGGTYTVTVSTNVAGLGVRVYAGASLLVTSATASPTNNEAGSNVTLSVVIPATTAFRLLTFYFYAAGLTDTKFAEVIQTGSLIGQTATAGVTTAPRIYISGSGDNATLLLTQNVTNLGAYFQFGSVVGRTDVTTAPYNPTTTVSATMSNAWTSGVLDGQTVPHTPANIQLGRGDPCKLLGFTAAQVKEAAANGCALDNKQYRTPTGAENQTMGSAGNFSSWQDPSNLYYWGRWFGPSNGSNPANRQFIPGNGYWIWFNGGWNWNSSGQGQIIGQNGTGGYWDSDMCATHHQVHFLLVSAIAEHLYYLHSNIGQSTALGVRCVPQ